MDTDYNIMKKGAGYKPNSVLCKEP